LAISRQRKEELTAQYVELINESRAVFLTEYTGLTVKQLEALREEVRKSGGAIHVTKNTLLINALRETGRPIPEDLLVGQIATGFALTEAPSLAKTLVDYAKKEDKLTLRGGILGAELLTPAQVQSLASLPSLDELRGQIIGLISAPARNIAGTIASGVRQIVNVLDAYAKKEEAAEAA
jgi:large subunit ribosomal protein L10